MLAYYIFVRKIALVHQLFNTILPFFQSFLQILSHIIAKMQKVFLLALVYLLKSQYFSRENGGNEKKKHKKVMSFPFVST